MPCPAWASTNPGHLPVLSYMPDLTIKSRPFLSSPVYWSGEDANRSVQAPTLQLFPYLADAQSYLRYDIYFVSLHLTSLHTYRILPCLLLVHITTLWGDL